MNNSAKSVKDYLENVSQERAEIFKKLYLTIKKNIPKEFEETLSYGMIGWVVPHSIYPKGYHCNTKLPLPFLSIASQKKFIAIHHMGMYANKNLYDWFVSEYPKHTKSKIDIGKSCIRLKKMDDIPFDLISELVQKMSAIDWITLYEKEFLK
ncbi:DUF1801 domain-containing protein [Halpernia sp.]|uniref:DUF1801 domain-containing protein n=1 Tax=Halpernia sp. TaxID=2782209 RepID=UPI003A940A06